MARSQRQGREASALYKSQNIMDLFLPANDKAHLFLSPWQVSFSKTMRLSAVQVCVLIPLSTIIIITAWQQAMFKTKLSNLTSHTKAAAERLP